jgi:hypothetical protein
MPVFVPTTPTLEFPSPFASPTGAFESDHWPALPDDTDLWTVPRSPHAPEHLRLLAREQAGEV